MKPKWIDLGPIEDLSAGRPVLKKGDGQRFVCVRQGDQIHALDDRCPHQGYPLSQGSVRDGVLTCEWHNWKFDLASGDCTFGGEPVRRYPTRVEDGRLHINVAVDKAAEARRLVAGLREAVRKDEPARALREGLRLGALGVSPRWEKLGPLYLAFEVLARDGAERAPWGFDHSLAMLADLCAWVERGLVPAEEAFVAASHAVGETFLHLGPRASSPGEQGKADPRRVLLRFAEPTADDLERVSEALLAERREEAEIRVRSLCETRGPGGARDALLPFVSRHLYDYGHGAIFLTKALELAERFPAAAPDVLGASALQLSWATAETSLPPFTATREALGRLAETKLEAPPREIAWDRPAYESDVLAGEAPAARATVARLAEGCDPRALLRAVGHAAAVRLSRFDSAWEARLDAEVGVLDVTHAVTFAEAAITLTQHASRRHAAQLAVIAAAFVGKLHKADAPEPTEPQPPKNPGDLLVAVQARDLGRALATVREYDCVERLEAYDKLAPFAAFDAAVRPIFYAHTVKTTEALRRLEDGDPQADGAYLRALLTYMVPIRKERRDRRTAAIARKFLEDGRPPEGLY